MAKKAKLEQKVIVALDFSSAKKAIKCAKKLDPKLCRVKVGLELFVSSGPKVIKKLHKLGFEIFLDLKFHDIPNTVAGAVTAAKLGVWMINIHALGGSKMMKAAKEALKSFKNPPLLMAVTVLTSMEKEDLKEIGIYSSPIEQVGRLTQLTIDCDLNGVVCSGKETEYLRNHFGNSFFIVNPGIRLANGDANDQARILTPEKAMKNGADYLVIGRPITQAKNPKKALNAMIRNAEKA